MMLANDVFLGFLSRIGGDLRYISCRLFLVLLISSFLPLDAVFDFDLEEETETYFLMVLYFLSISFFLPLLC